MQPKLFQTAIALYAIDEWDGINLSGLKPISNMILVRVDECAPFTAGGIDLPDEARENNSLASETGTIIAIGSQAFMYTLDGRKWPEDDPDRPKVGDRVWFQRYSGSEHQGYDKKLYRMMKDSQIGGLWDMEHAPVIEWPKRTFAAGEWSFPTIAASGDAMPIDGPHDEESVNA